ncbi:MAG: type IV pilus modification protein PilV [Candidatus Binatia bacterium]
MRSGEQGFSLLEVLVAMVVFSIAALGMASLQVGTIQANAQAKRRTQATNIAQTQIERLRQGQACNQDVVPSGYALNCQSVAGPDNTNEVTVTVSWVDYSYQSVRLKIRI